MIRGAKERKIESFQWLVSCGQGTAIQLPEPGTEFVGIPAGFIGENADPYIEVRKDGKIIASINISEVGYIAFAD